MSSEMEKMGQVFRTKREQMHLDIRECANSLSIRRNFLQAIEEGTIHESISGIYAVGFLKQYAQFLGIEMDALLKAFPGALTGREEQYDFSYGIGTLEMRGSLGGGIKWLPNLFWALAAGSIVVLAYYFAKAIGVL